VVAGTLIAYATQPGHVAYGGAGQNGYFTKALLTHLDTPGREVELMKDVRATVVAATRTKQQGPQVPWVHSSLMGAFYFRAEASAAPPAPTQPSGFVSGSSSRMSREQIQDYRPRMIDYRPCGQPA
jgi:uncharacterized caspase-like protein